VTVMIVTGNIRKMESKTTYFTVRANIAAAQKMIGILCKVFTWLL